MTRHFQFENMLGKVLDYYGADNNFFKLEDVVYEVLEDEDDGYRSYMGYVEKYRPDEVDQIFFKKPVARVEVKKAADIDGFELVDSRRRTRMAGVWDKYRRQLLPVLCVRALTKRTEE